MQNETDVHQHQQAPPLLREARNVVRNLPSDDEIAAVNQIRVALSTLGQSDELTPQARFEAVSLLDLPLIGRTRALLREYLNTTRHTRQREADIWHAAYDGWCALASAYLSCLRHAPSPAPEAAAVAQDHVRVLATRMLRALRRQLQWLRARYLSPPAALWKSLAGVYASDLRLKTDAV